MDTSQSKSCKDLRNECNWGSVRLNATQYFNSRAKKPGLIFEFDREILRQTYQQMKTQIKKFFQGHWT